MPLAKLLTFIVSQGIFSAWNVAARGKREPRKTQHQSEDFGSMPLLTYVVAVSRFESP